MKLEHLFDGETWYVGEGAWLYGEHEAAGFGEGEGTICGPRIAGRLRWANRPRRRPDGVWLPDVTGYIQTDDGVQVLVEFRGRSMPEQQPGDGRDVVCSIAFSAADERYRWLDTVVGIMEARYDAGSSRTTLRVHECVNELPARAASGPAVYDTRP